MVTEIINVLDQSTVGVLIHNVYVQVRVKQEQNSEKLGGKALALPDIEDCSKCSSSISLLQICGMILNYFKLLSEQWNMSAVPHGALGR